MHAVGPDVIMNMQKVGKGSVVSVFLVGVVCEV